MSNKVGPPSKLIPPPGVGVGMKQPQQPKPGEHQLKLTLG